MELIRALKGNYPQLFAEVVTCDQYRLKTVNFIPDVVIDLGANIGIFSRHCRTLFPNALIIAVEPSADNCSVFREHTNDEKIILINKAIGTGNIFHCPNPANGAMEVFLSEGPGYGIGYLNAHRKNFFRVNHANRFKAVYQKRR